MIAARTFVPLLLLATACSSKSSNTSKPPPAVGSAAPSDVGTEKPVVSPVTKDGLPILAPAPPLPVPPESLPTRPADKENTAARVALGELLFSEKRLSSNLSISCSTCHDPEHDFAGNGIQNTTRDAPNLRSAPSLTNIVWETSFAWDGRYPTIPDLLAPHLRGQFGHELNNAVDAIASVPLYRAHFRRAFNEDPSSENLIRALTAYVTTRFSEDAPWDQVERGAAAEDPTLRAGYELFTGKAQCASCHMPPLYTDLSFHRIGLIASPDDGRGRVEPALQGAFKTPSLRGAANRLSYFHDGSAKTLEAAIDYHLAGGTGQGADRSIVDPTLTAVALTALERDQLIAFVRSLSHVAAPAPTPITLP